PCPRPFPGVPAPHPRPLPTRGRGAEMRLGDLPPPLWGRAGVGGPPGFAQAPWVLASTARTSIRMIWRDRDRHQAGTDRRQHRPLAVTPPARRGGAAVRPRRGL